MDFVGVLAQVSGFLSEKKQAYAVIGGVALAAYGIARQTFDLDLVVDASVQDELIAYLETLGYETVYRSTGFSNHRHANPDRGNVDFVYVRDTTSQRLFDTVHELEGPAGERVPVPSPEHLIAMKLAAMKNDPTRTFQDLADIQFLVRLPHVDRDFVRGQFDKHGLSERFDELETN